MAGGIPEPQLSSDDVAEFRLPIKTEHDDVIQGQDRHQFARFVDDR